MISQLTTVESVADPIPPRTRRLSDVARSRLERDSYFRGRSNCIRIDEDDGTLVLHGRVPSYYLKQILQTTLGEIVGVKAIDNRVEVFWPTSSSVDSDE